MVKRNKIVRDQLADRAARLKVYRFPYHVMVLRFSLCFKYGILMIDS